MKPESQTEKNPPNTTGNLKPSERIEDIRLGLIRDDWVAFGGNQYSRASWFQICNQNPNYRFDAIIQYLDENFSLDHIGAGQ